MPQRFPVLTPILTESSAAALVIAVKNVNMLKTTIHLRIFPTPSLCSFHLRPNRLRIRSNGACLEAASVKNILLNLPDLFANFPHLAQP